MSRHTQPWIKIMISAFLLLLLKPPLYASTPALRATEQAAPNTYDEITAIGDTASNVRLLGQLGGSTNAVHIANGKAYLGQGGSLVILDLTQPTHPRFLGKTPLLLDTVVDIVVQGNYAYVAALTAGLQIFDITDSTRPIKIGFYTTAAEANDLYIVGNYAYLADDSGLRILNITNPPNPVEVGFYATYRYARAVYVIDNYAYIIGGQDAEDGSLLLVLDITNPAAPATVGSYAMPEDATDLYVVEPHVYVANNDMASLLVVDVTNPATPTEVGFYDTPGSAIAIYVVGDYAYMADGDGLRVINITQPTAPTLIGFYDSPGIAVDIVVDGSFAYVADDYSGLRIVDISNPATPTEVIFYDTPDGLGRVTVANHDAYIANGENGLWVVNIANPTAPVSVGFYDTPGKAQDVALSEHYAYVADDTQGVRIIDIANPAALTEVGHYDTPGRAIGIDVAEPYVYVADDDGLRIINATNAAAPTQAGFYDTNGRALDVEGGYFHAYVTDDQTGLRVLNVNNPTTPTAISTYITGGNANRVRIVGNYAYVTNGVGLSVVNLTNPQAPSQLGFYTTTGYAQGVDVAGDIAYVATGIEGLRVLNVRNPAAIAEVGFYQTTGYVDGVYVNGNTIFVSDSTNGLYLLRYPACYRLTLQFTGQGGVPTTDPANSPGCPANEYAIGTPVTLLAQPAANWRVASWQGTNNDNSTSTVNQLIMPAADYSVAVHYAPVCYPLTLTHTGSGNHPSANPANSTGCATGQYVAGQVITLTAAPGVGSTVGGWSGTSNDNSTANANTLTMPAASHTAGVSYGLACYLLTLAHTGSGSDPIATPEQSAGCPASAYHFEETVTLSASPASGWQVSAWSGTTNNSSTSTSNTLLMPAAAHTALVHYGETPTSAPGDLYELDNSCTRSRTITTDGSEVQEHSFHAGGDVDWVRFDAAANSKYRIEVTVPNTSTADVVMEVYPDCTSAPLDQWTGGFSPGARLELSRTISGPTYVRLSNDNASVAGDQVRYTLSVRKLGVAPANRMLIIVAGRLKLNDSVQANIDKVAANVYKLFQRNGYSDDNIHLLASNANLPGYDGAASKASVQAAIQQAASKVSNGVLTLYLVDHGTPELFYIDGVNEQTVTPSELNDWLTQLESAAPGVKINVIIEACEAGSFIDKPGSISKPGRVILTSTNADNDAKASKEGAYFSDHLLTWLQQGFNLSASFLEARTAAKDAYSLQEAWLDSNGNGLANEFDDGALAAQRSFAYAGTLADNEWPPHIFTAATVGPVSDQQVRLRVDVRDNGGVRQVWAVLYDPNYTPPTPTQVLQPEVLPTFLFTRVDNENHWEAEVTGLTQTGTYRLIIQADDEQGLVARPVTVEVNTATPNEGKIFLPTIGR